MICSGQNVIRSGIASVLNPSKDLRVIGSEGANVLEEACVLQPDLLIYQIQLTECYESEYELLKKLKKFCSCTKIILFTLDSISLQIIKKFVPVSDGYLQGPLLPSFLPKALQLACYSGHFLYLGSLTQLENKNELLNVSILNANTPRPKLQD